MTTNVPVATSVVAVAIPRTPGAGLRAALIAVRRFAIVGYVPVAIVKAVKDAVETFFTRITLFEPVRVRGKVTAAVPSTPAGTPPEPWY